MPKATPDAADNHSLTKRGPGCPSIRLKRFLDEIVKEVTGPILDAPCGFGRNALPLAERGCTVICADISPQCLDTISGLRTDQLDLRPLLIDLTYEELPFEKESLSGLINAHFVQPALILRVAPYLCPGAFVFIESYENRGHNYLQLPKAGEFRKLLRGFNLLHYEEKPVGRHGVDAVAFHCLARK